MELTTLFKWVVGVDVHQAKITACAIAEDEGGNVSIELAEFGGFKRDRKALAQWVAGHHPEAVMMESTGIHWESPYAALEEVGIVATAVNARHVKTVPGRKTDWADAQWLAMFARAGMLNVSFVPPAQFRTLRLVVRQRQKLVGILSGEKNPKHKLLSDGGIRLSVVVRDIHGKAARAMIKALLSEKSPTGVLMLSGTRLKADRTELFDAFEGDLTAEHRFVLKEWMAHIEVLERPVATSLLRKSELECRVAASMPAERGGDVGGGEIIPDLGAGQGGQATSLQRRQFP